MAFEFHLPDLAEGMAEAEIVAWKVKVGDKVKLDQPLVEVMSDKATVEIGSPRAGTLSKINFAEGQVCPVGVPSKPERRDSTRLSQLQETARRQRTVDHRK